METQCSWSDVQILTVLLVGYSEVQLELEPRFVRGGLAFPDFASIAKYAGAKNQFVSNVEDLFRGIRGLPGSCKFNCVFNFFLEHFEGLIDIARLFHGAVIVVKIGRGNLGVVGVEVSHDLERSTCPDSNLSETEGGKIHRADYFKNESGDDNAHVHIFLKAMDSSVNTWLMLAI
jgi:hypothetical protein